MLVWILPTFFYYGRCASGGCTNLLDEDAVRIQPLDRCNFLIFTVLFLANQEKETNFDTKSGKNELKWYCYTCFINREDDIGTQIQDRFGKVVNDLGNSADMVKVYNRLMSVDAITRLAFIYGVGVRNIFCLFLNTTNNHTFRSGLENGPIPGNSCFFGLAGILSFFLEFWVFFLNLVKSLFVSLSENHHFKDEKLEFHTKMFSFFMSGKKALGLTFLWEKIEFLLPILRILQRPWAFSWVIEFFPWVLRFSSKCPMCNTAIATKSQLTSCMGPYANERSQGLILAHLHVVLSCSLLWALMISHLSKGPGDLKHNGTQERNPFLS